MAAKLTIADIAIVLSLLVEQHNLQVANDRLRAENANLRTQVRFVESGKGRGSHRGG